MKEKHSWQFRGEGGLAIELWRCIFNREEAKGYVLGRTPPSRARPGFRDLPGPLMKRELPRATLGLEIGWGRTSKPVQPMNRRTLRTFPGAELSAPVPTASPLSHNVVRAPSVVPLLLVLPSFFFILAVRMIYGKYLTEHFISLLTTQQWLPIICRIKGGLYFWSTWHLI